MNNYVNYILSFYYISIIYSRMFQLPVMNEQQIVEGITASITFPFIILYLKKQHWGYTVYMMLAWFITWMLRKTSVNLYHIVKQRYQLKNKTYHISLPSF